MTPEQTLADRYRLEHEVGHGSFGIVYLATELATGRQIAVKVLAPWTKNDRELTHRLQREARLTQMLHSPHTVRIFELGFAPDGTLFVAMEFLRGSDLGSVLAQHGPLAVDRVQRIAVQALDAIGEAHKLGVVHRDLKPSNIMLCTDEAGREQVKVLDFGIAKVAGGSGTGSGGGSALRETTRLTAPGGILGTPAYMSPEQCRGEPLTTASDLYSLGVVLYELLTGNPPFADPNPVQVMVAHNIKPPPPLPSELAQSRLGWAIMQALDKEPARRPASCEEFAALLTGQQVAAPLPAARPVPGPAPVAAYVPAADEPQSPHAAPSGSGSWLAPAVVVAVIILAVLARILL